MHNNIFSKAGLNAPADLAVLEKSTPLIPPLDED
jgi:hypothetical protein